MMATRAVLVVTLALVSVAITMVSAEFALGDTCRDPHWANKCKHIGGTCVMDRSLGDAARGKNGEFVPVCKKLLKSRGDLCPTQFHVCPASYPDCIKPPGKPAKCNKLMPSGGQCGRDPYWVCQSAFKCIGNRCKKVLTKRGDLCPTQYHVCPADYPDCIKPRGKPGKCNKIMGVGGRCGTDPYWTCSSELICASGRCAYKPRKLGETCSREDQNMSCEDGLHCLEPRGTCTKIFAPGEKCRVHPHMKCRQGHLCAKPSRKKPAVCLEILHLHDQGCGNHLKVCDTDLKCVYNKCVPKH